MFQNVDAIQYAGFVGFITIRELRSRSLAEVPQRAGVYVVVRQSSGTPKFHKRSCGGHFKDRDPTVDLDELTSNLGGWNTRDLHRQSRAPGKAATLRSRLKQYLDFGTGKPIGHWGGRLIWQVDGCDDFLIAWRPTTDDEVPRDVERQLIADFKDQFGVRPFANLQD